MSVSPTRLATALLVTLLVASMPAAAVHTGAAASAGAGSADRVSSAPAGASVAVQNAGTDPTITIESVAGTAGGASVPSSVSAFVRIEDGDDPYQGSVAADDVDVTVGNQSVPTDTITTTQVQPGQYLLTFGPPTQNSSGNYDLTVEFDGSTNDTVDGAIVYSQTESSVIAASLQMDRSGSMGNIMQEARSGGLAFVEQASNDSYVSVVPYSGGASIAQPLVQLEDGRQDARNTISGLNSGGGTNIASAVSTGLDSLEDAPEGTVKAGILMTDGRDSASRSQVLNNLVPKYNDRGICLYTIGFTREAQSGFLQDVADAADCGSYAFAAESGEADQAAATLQDVFEDMQTDVSGDSTLDSSDGEVAGGETQTGTVSVDDSVQQATVNIQFDGVDLSGATTQSLSVAPLAAGSDYVTLYDPDGNPVDENRSGVDVSVVDDTVIYRIDDPQPGEWSYELRNPDDTDRAYSATVTGFAQTTLELVTNADTYYEGGQTSVVATLTGQEQPIEAASVAGEVTAPDGSVENVTLTEISAGVYTTDVDVEQSGTYELTALATKDELSRADTLQWEVQQGEPVSFTQAGSSQVDQGATETVDVTLERAADGGNAQEIVVGVGSLEQTDGGGSVTADQLSIQNQTVQLAPGENATVSLTVDAARDLPYGTYSGAVQAYLEDGSVVDGAVNATIDIDREPADYAGNAGSVDVEGLLDAVDEFRDGVIDVDHLLEVVDAFATDAQVT